MRVGIGPCSDEDLRLKSPRVGTHSNPISRVRSRQLDLGRREVNSRQEIRNLLLYVLVRHNSILGSMARFRQPDQSALPNGELHSSPK